MTPEQLQELEEKAKLWDSLGKPLLDMYGSPIKQHKDVVFDSKPISEYKSTIENVSNASTFIDVLKEESDDFTNSVKFWTLTVGQEFECYGDFYLNYNYPKICRCIKDDETTGKEIDGIRFSMSKNDSVFVRKSVNV